MSQRARREADAGPEGPWLEPLEATPRLLLFPPQDEGAAATVAALIEAGAVAALVVEPATLRGWRERVAPHRAALLALDEPVDGADGVHLADPARVAELRQRLGRERILGAACGLSRHAGMVAGEAGADYVMFGALDRRPEPGDELFELVGWWNELFVIPCAAAGPLDPDLCRSLAAAGADLLATRRADAGIASVLQSAAAGPLRN